MSVSTIDGTIESLEPGRSGAGAQIFKRMTFKLPDGSSKSVVKFVTHKSVADQLRPGVTGRFYLYTAIDHRGLHGFRDARGGAWMKVPKNNEMAVTIVTIMMGLWVGVAAATLGGIPLLPGILFVLGLPTSIYLRKMRADAERQFAADSGYQPSPPPSLSPEPAVGA